MKSGCTLASIRSSASTAAAATHSCIVVVSHAIIAKGAKCPNRVDGCVWCGHDRSITSAGLVRAGSALIPARLNTDIVGRPHRGVYVVGVLSLDAPRRGFIRYLGRIPCFFWSPDLDIACVYGSKHLDSYDRGAGEVRGRLFAVERPVWGGACETIGQPGRRPIPSGRAAPAARPARVRAGRPLRSVRRAGDPDRDNRRIRTRAEPVSAIPECGYDEGQGLAETAQPSGRFTNVPGPASHTNPLMFSELRRLPARESGSIGAQKPKSISGFVDQILSR